MGSDETSEGKPLLAGRKSGMAALEVKVVRGSGRELRGQAGERRLALRWSPALKVHMLWATSAAGQLIRDAKIHREIFCSCWGAQCNSHRW